jgi:tetratricopeptide (TPR) repeat protein
MAIPIRQFAHAEGLARESSVGPSPGCAMLAGPESVECREGNSVKSVLSILLWFVFQAATESCTAQARAVPDPRRQEALALEQHGKNQEAEAIWRAILNTHQRDPEPLAHLGLLEARQGHYKEAVPLYRRALAINPNVAGLRLNLALALFKAGELKAAIPEFDILRKSAPAGSPDEQRITILTGMAYYGLGDYVKAAPYLKEASDRDASNLQLLLALEHSYLWSNQFEHVLDVYHQILILSPDSAEADMVAGEALDQLKDNGRATEMFRAAVKADPKQPEAHFGLGYLLWTQKQYSEAAEQFKAELLNDPGNIQAKLYLADADIQMNDFSEATLLLQSVVKASPSLGLAHLDLGIVESRVDHNQDALREFIQAEKMMPNEVNVHWRLARLYRRMGKNEEARVEFDKARHLNKEADDALSKKISDGAANLHQRQGAQSQPPPAPPD